MTNNTETTKRKGFLPAFVEGANQGIKVGFTSMIPNVIFAFAMIQFLNMTGLTDLIGRLFQPVMAIVGLPGIAATAIMAAFLSTGGGIGVAAGLAASGQLNSRETVIILVGIILCGAMVQYVGRLLGTAGVSSKHYGPLIAINVITAFLGMFVTQFLV